MDIQSENAIRASLESTRDAIQYSKYAIESILTRLEKTECDVEIHRDSIAKIEREIALIGVQLGGIQKAYETMSVDMRTIRNGVITALLGALLIGTASLALNSLNSRQTSTRAEIQAVLVA